MILQAIITGFVLGLVSSLHCVGMCGPIALSLPVKHLSNQRKKTAVLLYNSGRVAGYTLLGLIFGLLGRQFYLAGIQQWFSIAAGIIILFFILQFYVLKKVWQPVLLQKAHQYVQTCIIKLLSKKNWGSYFAIGAANSFLPCGVVYIAIASALSFSTVQLSMLFMTAFGTGTLPLMMVLGLLGNTIAPAIRIKLKNAIPFMITIVAFLLIVRGLNLGIPFISPLLSKAPPDAVICH